jgi:mycothiol synthase
MVHAADRPTVERREVLTPTEVVGVMRLVDAATEADGVRPLSEHVLLHLRYGGEAAARHLLLHTPGGRLAGYAHLDVTDPVAGASAELVVEPGLRGRGYGRALTAELSALVPEGDLRLWAHGEHPAAAALAGSLGFERLRALWQLRRPLHEPLPEAPVPAGVTVRTFRPGADDRTWVALNALAFAGHPEQGSWTLTDLHRRMAEPWFDPDGFFVAERDERMVGFHWTKVHGGEADAHGHAPIGEIYVLGVAPGEQGSGLGRALSVVGLRHLRGRGLAEAMLYVEADNPPAIHLYASLGFSHWDTDVVFRRRGAAARSS